MMQEDYKFDLLDDQSISEEGLSLKERLEAASQAKDSDVTRTLRKSLQFRLLMLLSFEVVFLAYLILCQGLKHLLFTTQPFALNEWVFGFFVNGTLLQTFLLVKPIVKSLFPSSTDSSKSH